MGFPFRSLVGRNTIGCNDAFKVGADVVQICMFGDASWFHENKFALETFPNTVVCCAPALLNLNVDWLKCLHRQSKGLHTGNVVGWNNSTGAAAVNLAITLGSTRIFLLGFDMKSEPKRSHWHQWNKKKIKDASYQKFILGFKSVSDSLPKFPGVSVINVTNGDSQLPFFPRITFEVFHKYVPLKDRVPCQSCIETRQQHAKELSRP